MEVRSHSMMFGYRNMDAKMVQRRPGATPELFLPGIGRTISVDEYIQNGFHIVDASVKELEAMVSAGYESRRILLRFYEEVQKDKAKDQF
ncbi:MAG: hypothetical protein KDK39_15455 [Leptospiraceae bacterium]|nr:hypothetical protein [Leptospiraceae bacterium]